MDARLFSFFLFASSERCVSRLQTISFVRVRRLTAGAPDEGNESRARSLLRASCVSGIPPDPLAATLPQPNRAGPRMRQCRSTSPKTATAEPGLPCHSSGSPRSERRQADGDIPARSLAYSGSMLHVSVSSQTPVDIGQLVRNYARLPTTAVGVSAP